MGKIICIVGKSASGKDTIYRRIMSEITDLKKYLTYTTRPMRSGEVNGQEYYFVDEEEFQRLKRKGKVIEDRVYNTMYGKWRYFTVDDNIDLEKINYCIIGTPSMCKSLKSFYKAKDIVSILIWVDDGERLARAVERERKQRKPQYKELCRRFLADEEDFSDDKINKTDIDAHFNNNALEVCVQNVKKYVMKILSSEQ